MKQRGDTRTLDMLEDWQPPVVEHAPETVRAATFRGKLARAVSRTLQECAMDRATVALLMSEYLGTDVSEHMLNAYAAEHREEHNISTERLQALCAVTGDWRPIGVLIDGSGMVLIERCWLGAVKEAETRAKKEDLLAEADRLDAIERQARREWRGR